MTQRARLIMADNDMTHIDYYKLWQPLSDQQFAGRGMYGDVKQDNGAYLKGNINEKSE